MRRNGLGRKPRASLVALVVAIAFAGVASAEDPQRAPTASGWRSGQEVYDKVCGHCHDTGVGPAIRGRQLPPGVVAVFARNGSRAMPAFRSAEIDDAAMAQLADFVSKN
jgi:mono/diheme cytochrome c family protein